MKSFKRIMLGAVILITALLTVIVPMADNVVEGTTNANVVIGLGSIKSTEGKISIDDPQGIVTSVNYEAYLGSVLQTANVDRIYMFTGGNAENAQIKLSVTLRSDAPVGACATFNYAGGYTDANDEYSASGLTGSASVCIVAPSTPTPTPTPSTPSKPGTGVKVNYSGLFNQISFAEKLNVVEFTPLSVALNSAKNLMAEQDQTIIDLVAAMLEVIIAGVN